MFDYALGKPSQPRPDDGEVFIEVATPTVVTFHRTTSAADHVLESFCLAAVFSHTEPMVRGFEVLKAT